MSNRFSILRTTLCLLGLIVSFSFHECANARDTDDLIELFGAFKGGPGGDLNQDGETDHLDVFLFALDWQTFVTVLQDSSPVDGEIEVAVTRETRIQFSNPLDASSVTDETIFATFGGKKLRSRLHVSPIGDVVTIFYENPLPPSSRVRVSVVGDLLLDSRGGRVDADFDGQAGGTATIDFETLNLAVIPGTRVRGRVFASELVTPQGSSQEVSVPLEGVLITVDGAEDTLFTVTNNLGNFTLDPAPAGKFFVHVDGRAVTSALIGGEIVGTSFPSGPYYPFVGKPWDADPGIETNVGDIFLPLVRQGSLQSVDSIEDTVLTFSQDILSSHPELGGLTLVVPPDSLYRDDGTRGGMVGIAPVAPNRLPGPLPEGLNFPLVITVQTASQSPGEPAPTNFDRPVPVCFPNLPNPDIGEVLPPGAKSALWSFNHDIGQWEVVGSMTVSEDGLTVCTDPGVGILAPGWHAPAPGSSGAGGPMEDDPGSEDEELGCQDSPPAPPAAPEECKDEDAGDDVVDPVFLFSGEFYHEERDLHIKGRGMDFIWSRKYRSKRGLNSAQGVGWDFSYNIFVTQSAESEGRNPGEALTLVDIGVSGGSSSLRGFKMNPSSYGSHAGYFSQLREVRPLQFSMDFPGNGSWNFHPLDRRREQGKIENMVDRNGNTISFNYDLRGRLQRVTDTLNRDILIAYNPKGFIETVTDFTGRQVRYEYYSDSDPGGSFGDLKSVTSPSIVGTPNGNDFPNGKTTTYTYSKGFEDRRLNHNLLTITDGRRNDPNDPTFGKGPWLVNEYASTTEPTDLFYDRIVRQTWGNPDEIVDLHYVRLNPSIDNGNAYMRTIINDRVGNVKEYFFDRGNRVTIKREYTGRADPDLPTTQSGNRPTDKLRPEDPDFFETRYEWNQDSLKTRVVHPNGNITENIYETDLNRNTPPRFRANKRFVRYLPGAHTPAGDQAVIEEQYEYDADFGCSSCGSNFVTRHVDGRGNETLHQYDESGNRIHSQHRIASIVNDFTYNEFGQRTSRTHPDNGSGHRRRDQFTYYDSGPQRGYLHEAILDSTSFELTTTLEYDLVGNVVKKIDPRGNDKQFIFNELDQVVRMVSREVEPGSDIRYERDTYYDANNRITRRDIQNVDENGVIQANSHFSTSLAYDILNFPVSTTAEVDNDRSIVTEYEYDGNRNLSLIKTGESTNGNQPSNLTRYLYDERDLPYQTILAEGDPDQSTTQYDYDQNGNLIVQEEGLEDAPRISEFTYDGFNRLVQKLDPMGNTVASRYDSNHNLVHELTSGELEDVEGRAQNIRLDERSSVYDQMDRVVRGDTFFFDTNSQNPIADGSATAQYFYSDNSQVTRILNDNGHSWNLIYDTANRVSEVVDPKNNTVRMGYDGNSNLTRLSSVEKADLGNGDQLFTTTFAHDGLDRKMRTIDNIGNTRSYAHDSRGNLILSRDANDNRTGYVYDGLNRLTETLYEITDSGNGAGTVVDEIRTLQTWDDNSRLTSRTDDNGNVSGYAYDSLDRTIQALYADGTQKEQSFDVHHNVVQSTDANGSITRNSFDLLNRLAEKIITPGPGVSSDTTFERFTYDGRSRPVQLEDDDSAVSFGYDSLSHPVRETLNGVTTTTSYDALGNMLSCVYPSGRTVVSTFDELERLQTITDAGGAIASYAFVGPHRVAQCSFGNGTRLDIAYDGITGVANQAGDFGVKQKTRTTHSVALNGTVFEDRTYSWDSMNNKTSITDVLNFTSNREFTYDSIYRLVHSTSDPAKGAEVQTEYELDGVGNRTTVTGGIGAGVYTLDETTPIPGDRQVNQYTSTPFDTRKYDNNGNLVTVNPAAPNEKGIEYDYRNRMVGHTDGNSTYAYDALGRRIKKTVNNGAPEETRYFYKGVRVVEEQDGGGNVGATYVYGHFVDEVINMERGSESYFYHCDDIYSARAVTDSDGDVVERYDYGDYGEPMIFDPIGSPLAESQIDNPYLFTGRRYDSETGYYYFRTRYLDPAAGRFTSRDMIGIWTDSLNLGNGYSYVGNNPLSHLDPMGLFFSEALAAEAAAKAAPVVIEVVKDVAVATGGASAAAAAAELAAAVAVGVIVGGAVGIGLSDVTFEQTFETFAELFGIDTIPDHPAIPTDPENDPIPAPAPTEREPIHDETDDAADAEAEEPLPKPRGGKLRGGPGYTCTVTCRAVGSGPSGNKDATATAMTQHAACVAAKLKAKAKIPGKCEKPCNY